MLSCKNVVDDFSRASPSCIAEDGRIASFLSAGREFFRYQKYGLGGMNINYLVETSRAKKGSRLLLSSPWKMKEKTREKKACENIESTRLQKNIICSINFLHNSTSRFYQLHLILYKFWSAFLDKILSSKTEQFQLYQCMTNCSLSYAQVVGSCLGLTWMSLIYRTHTGHSWTKKKPSLREAQKWK